jgi:multidrug efflux pump subunit AcrB
MNSMGVLTVQFYVGQDMERSLVKLYNELMKNMDRMPKGVTMPLVKTRAISDVPVLAFTLWSDNVGDYRLRQIAEVAGSEIKKIPDVAIVNVIGGRSRMVKVLLNKDKMAEYKIDFGQIAQYLRANNTNMQSGNLVTGNRVFSVETGNFFTDAGEIRNLIVGTSGNSPVYLYQIAKVEDGPETPRRYVSFGYGAASNVQKMKMPGSYPAVTIAVAKKKGADAMKVAEAVENKMQHLKHSVITEDVHVNVTRNYGETASRKVSELLLHLLVAIIAVTLFVMLAMGWRGGLVVVFSVPVTFALTLFSYYFLGYTLNRITLFALVFVTGIVVDDSIVIAENMHRHFKMNKLPPLKAALYAINEVGNPTILATLTVIAAVLPMAFVSGMMGPYMSPMPIGASIAMVFSLLIALTLTPYFGYLFLRHKDNRSKEKNTVVSGSEEVLYESRIYRIYKHVLNPFLESRRKRMAFMLGLLAVLLFSLSFFYMRWVPVKMLPFDNKNEFQVVVDMPEGTTLESTEAVTRELASYISENGMVTDFQTYSGTSAPMNFNGLVRNYDLRSSENMADIQVNLIDKGKRSIQSHNIAGGMRTGLQKIGRKYGANVKIVEVPPGPPVMSTLVAEIYGPDYKEQIKVAEQVEKLMSESENVADVDWSVESDQQEYKFEVNKDKAMRMGITSAQIVSDVRAALHGMDAGVLHSPRSLEQTGIVLQYPESEKSDVNDLLGMNIMGKQGVAVPLCDLVTVSRGVKAKSIQRKDQKRVVYVLAEVAGNPESPIYAINGISRRLSEVKVPDGYSLNENFTRQPDYEDDFTLKWDGEWQITYEVFRDLGFAFMLVLIIIYVLIVAWFQDFLTPLVQLSVIPLSLIGIVLGHWALGAYFSAPSMIGFIALAGIMVRNSILLIDFIDIRLAEGVPLKQAVIESGAVRSTPIMLTAGSVVLGATIILFDPIFQGLAISLIGGTITSTVLTLIVVPLLYFKMKRR